MSYIKINKDSLDYDYHARFHSYTMNNFVRNIMRNGKYKKALRMARSGLLWALKRIREGLIKRYLGLNAVYNTREAVISRLSNTTQNQIIDTLKVYKDTNIIVDEEKSLFDHKILLKKLKGTSVVFEKDLKIYSDGIINTDEVILPLEEQYGRLKDELEFQKIYTKRPRVYFLKNRKYTIFDMIIQAYTAVANVWTMRKIKVSGRTVLVPIALRPYRRISVVTKMIMIGIRQLRKEERFFKNAMIKSIATEFFYILFYYDPIRVKGNITASKIWQLKLKSQKELVANLKNIKHGNYI